MIIQLLFHYSLSITKLYYSMSVLLLLYVFLYDYSMIIGLLLRFYYHSIITLLLFYFVIILALRFDHYCTKLILLALLVLFALLLSARVVIV